MADGIVMHPQAVTAVGMVRPRAGAVVGPDGRYATSDMEAVISLQMGCLRDGVLVGADGKQTGMMVPVGEVVRPVAEMIADAEARFAAAGGRIS